MNSHLKTTFQIITISIIWIMYFSISSTAQSKNTTVSIKTEIFCDHCNKCASCGKNIYNSIHELKGIKSVKINASDNEIIVKYNSRKIDKQQIIQSINKAGFKADNSPSDKEAYEKLDNCCKKNNKFDHHS